MFLFVTRHLENDGRAIYLTKTKPQNSLPHKHSMDWAVTHPEIIKSLCWAELPLITLLLKKTKKPKHVRLEIMKVTCTCGK